MQIHFSSKTDDWSTPVDFFKEMAKKYGEYPNVIYEIFNEPTTYHGALGQLTWHEWKTINEEIIGDVRIHNSKDEVEIKALTLKLTT